MLTEDQKTVVKATIPVLKENGVALTSHFYKRMFSHNPELKNIFNMGNQKAGKQQMALAMAVVAYAENIDDPSVLLPVVDKIGQKHVSLGIRAEHYPIVGNHLIASIQEVLGDAATPDIVNAWTQAYNDLADLFINYESNLYSDKTSQEGGWTGWRPFIVKKKVQESEEITSFYLYPGDHGKVQDFKPGQYLSVNLFIPELELFQARQYSLSNSPNGEYYRISVKKEKGAEKDSDGLISNHLHDNIQEGDMIEVAAPAGDFTLDVSKDNPVVFISGGIGQTPLLSMLETLVKTGSDRKVVWVHGCRSCQVHAFDDLINEYGSNGNLKNFLFYEQKDGSKECFEGIVDVHKLGDDVKIPGAEYYICGPSPFIKKQYNDLKDIGVKPEAIFYEEFGPHILSLA